MKIKLLNLLNKILKKFAFLGFFSFTTSVSAQQASYQCIPCPEGTTSNYGSKGIESCVPVNQKTSSNTIWNGITANKTSTIQPGWYKIILTAKSGTTGTNCSVSRTCSSAYSCLPACSATGGKGANGNQLTYIIYVKEKTTATFTAGIAPKVQIKGNSGALRTFSLTAASNGTNASCNTYTHICSNGTAGTTTSKSSASGLVYQDLKVSEKSGSYTVSSCSLFKL